MKDVLNLAPRWFFRLALLWTILVGVLVLLNIRQQQEEVLEHARTRLRSAITRDLAFRHWAAMHGGVYVPVTEETPPNPHLSHVAERDIATPSGRPLTLMNPAYMMRQVYELTSDITGLRSKLTSLKPLREASSPDDWEQRALRDFERGLPERSEVVDEGGVRLLRHILPFVTEASCLKCHAHQGYRVGDIRGGLSVALPLDKVMVARGAVIWSAAMYMAILWLTGLLGLCWATRVIDRNLAREVLASRRARDAEERLRTLINAAPDIVCFKDGEGRWQEANQAALELFRLQQVDFHGRTDGELAEFTDPLYRQAFLAREETDRAAWEAGIVFRQDESIPLPGGGAKVFDVIKAPLFAEDGRRKGLVVFCRDITERQRNAELLRESENFLRHVLDSIQDGIIVLDRDLRIVMSNRAMERWYVDRMPLVGRLCHDVCRQRETCPDCAIASVLTEGRPRRQLTSLSDGQGGTRYQERSIYPTFNAAQEVQGAIVFVRDITELRRVEETQRRLAAAVEQAADVVVITDTGGLIEYVNPAFEQLSGYPRAEVLGRNISLIQSDRHDEAFHRVMWQTIAAGQSWQGHFINRRKDGELFEVEATIAPIRDGEGRIVSYVSVQHDFSREKELRSQLAAAQKIESLGVLAGGVAHDFNNVLAAVQGYAELALLDLAPESPLHGNLRQILQAAQRAGAIVRQLLLFSRRQGMELVPVNLGQLVQNFLKMLGRLIGEDIRIVTELAPDLWSMAADPGTIEQVVMNLAVNARDAMPEGGSLTIACDNVQVDAEYCAQNVLARPGRFVRLTVADSGCGMGGDTLAHIFEPFFTTKQVGKGTGLGLAVVYGIVKEHKGWITASSSPGAGSVFEVYLPASAQRIVDEGGGEGEDRELFRGAGELILLVEDDVQIRTMIATLLRGAGYQVLVAASAGEALGLYDEAAPPRLLLSDVILPDISGLQLAETLRERCPGLPVILCSGYTGEKAQEGAIRDRGFVFLAKPYRLPELLRCISGQMTEDR